MGWFLSNVAGGIIRWGVATLISAICLVFGLVPAATLAAWFGEPPSWVVNPWMRLCIVIVGMVGVLIIVFWDRVVRRRHAAAIGGAPSTVDLRHAGQPQRNRDPYNQTVKWALNY